MSSKFPTSAAPEYAKVYIESTPDEEITGQVVGLVFNPCLGHISLLQMEGSHSMGRSGLWTGVTSSRVPSWHLETDFLLPFCLFPSSVITP